MTKKIIRTVSVLIVALMVISISINSFATDGYDVNQFKDIGDTSGAKESVSRVIGAIINVAQIVGTGVAIIMLIVLAIKYISAAPGDKADIKKHAVIYVVGAVVLFAATGLLEIIKQFAANV